MHTVVGRGGGGACSLSIVGRLSALRSVHYRRFHCMCIALSCHYNGTQCNTGLRVVY